MSSYRIPSISEIEASMLNNMPKEYVKGEGTFTNDLIKSYAIQDNILETKLALLFSKLDVNNLFEEELERYVFQRRGVKRKAANSAIGVLEVKGTGTIAIGDIFETEAGTRFVAAETKEIKGTGIIEIKAVLPGAAGNVGANNITYIPVTIQGISGANNPEATYDGYEIETDDSLRERYLVEIQKPATSGNIYHYMQWAREVVGVGDSKIFPLWNGNNTVQIVIIDDEKKPANSELIERTQNYIDPKGEDNITWGTGAGEAPIGAYCTVSSAEKKEINIEASLVLEDGYELEELKPLIKNHLEEYLRDIAFKKSYVSYALLSSWILNVEGVLEWTSFLLNSTQNNVTIGNKEVAILGEVNLNVT